MAEYVANPNKAMIALSQGHASDPEGAGAGDDDDGSSSSARRAAARGLGGGSGSGGRKPRGRPPGSKNKPKPPVVITRESEAAMRPVVLEVGGGCDVLGGVSAFALRHRVGVSVLSGSGAVAGVALRHPSAPASTVALHGRFDLLSLSGTLLPPGPFSAAAAASASSSSSSASASAAAPPTTSSGGCKAPQQQFTVSLAGAQGQVIGGTVAGPLTAAGTVVVVAATFVNPEFHRLPYPTSAAAEDAAAAAEEEEAEEKDDAAAEAADAKQVAPPPPQPQPPPLYGAPTALTGQLGRRHPHPHPHHHHQHQHQHQHHHDMVLWAQPSSARAPSHPPPPHPSHHY